MTQVSNLAHVHPGARIGQDVTIEPFVTIQEDVEIGDGCWIASHAMVCNGARIGKNCQIYPGAIIASVPQDLKFQNEYSTVELGDNVSVREYATIHRGTAYSHKTQIGSHVLIMAYSHVAHDCIIHDHAIVANGTNIAGHVVVGEYAVIGGMVAVHQFSRIGKHSMIAGGAMVRKDVPPFVLAGRDPISYVGVNHRGIRRRGYSDESIREIQEVYRTLFLSGHNFSQALDIIEEKFPASTERDEILDFVRNSERGIMRGYNFM